MLAAVADGEIQLKAWILNQIKKSSRAKKYPDDAARAAIADVCNKFSAGMETKHILEQLCSN